MNYPTLPRSIHDRARSRGIDLEQSTSDFTTQIRTQRSKTRAGRDLFRLTDAQIDERLGKALTARENEVMLLTAAGYTVTDTAEALECSFDTVREHKKRAFHKLAAVNAPHAVALWMIRQAA